jgi:hypothetical protein
MPLATHLRIGATLLALLGTGRVAANEHVYAASVPGGGVRVLVVVTDAVWPAGGFRVEDAAGAVLVAKIAPDPSVPLDAASRNALAALWHGSAGSDEKAKTGAKILVLRLLSDWAFARAAGAGIELPPDAHPKAIRIALLGADGAVGSRGPAVTVSADGGPPAASALRAQASVRGVTLGFRTAAQASAIPAYAYTVERSVGAARDALTLHPQLLTLAKPGEPNPFIDHAPPLETEIRYALRIVDVLGVESAAATASVIAPDVAAGTPPARLTAKSGRGSVSLAWSAPEDLRTSGLVVERAQLVEGPYERLTPEGLAPRTVAFEDRNILAGGGYYYRVRSVTPAGALGAAGDPVFARPLLASALAAPQGLRADVGRSEVALGWTQVAGASLAGYIVERRSGSASPRWSRLNVRLDPDPRFLDPIGPGSGGAFEYRVTAVASDESLGAPSEVLRVKLADSEPPPAPLVLSASGADGHVEIRFAAAEPAEKTDKVLLIRSESLQEAGLVVGAPVNAASGLASDDWVRAGQAYWYRLVALDRSGNRSEESEAHSVRVGARELPTPKPPSVSYRAEPAAAVELGFAEPPPHVRVLIQVALEDGRWRTVLGPMSGTSAVDHAPPGAHARYRIVYVGESGGAGSPSDPASAP